MPSACWSCMLCYSHSRNVTPLVAPNYIVYYAFLVWSMHLTISVQVCIYTLWHVLMVLLPACVHVYYWLPTVWCTIVWMYWHNVDPCRYIDADVFISMFVCYCITTSSLSWCTTWVLCNVFWWFCVLGCLNLPLSVNIFTFYCLNRLQYFYCLCHYHMLIISSQVMTHWYKYVHLMNVFVFWL